MFRFLEILSNLRARVLSDILVSINSGNLYIELIRPVFVFLSQPQQCLKSDIEIFYSINSGRTYGALIRPLFASIGYDVLHLAYKAKIKCN